MPGAKIVFPGQLSGPGLQRVVLDSMITDGTLLLVEPANPSGPWAAGVPAANARVPNLAAEQAQSLVGLGAEVRPQWLVGSAQSPSNSKFERTTKGGLHGIVSKVDTGVNKGAHLALPASILSYVWGNPTHLFYSSLWMRFTRAGVPTSSAVAAFLAGLVGNASTTGSTAFAYRSTLIRPSDSQGSVGVRPSYSPAESLAPALMNNAAPVYNSAGDTPIGASAIFGAVAIQPSGSYDVAHMPSWVMYRQYIEDLTVSGRTYAEVDALDFAKYSAEVTTVGGRYYGDTYTDPATLP